MFFTFYLAIATVDVPQNKVFVSGTQNQAFYALYDNRSMQTQISFMESAGPDQSTPLPGHTKNLFGFQITDEERNECGKKLRGIMFYYKNNLPVEDAQRSLNSTNEDLNKWFETVVSVL